MVPKLSGWSGMIPGRDAGVQAGKAVTASPRARVLLGRPRSCGGLRALPLSCHTRHGALGVLAGTFGLCSAGVHYSVESAGDGAVAGSSLQKPAKDERDQMTSRILVVD